MRALVIGAGRTGHAVALDLARQPGIDAVKLLDRDGQLLNRAGQSIEHELARQRDPAGSARIEGRRLEVLGEGQGGPDAALQEAMNECRVAVCCIASRHLVTVTRSAIAARTHLVDLGASREQRARQRELNTEVADHELTVLSGCGLAPGLTNLLGARAWELFTDTKKVTPRDRLTELDFEHHTPRRHDVSLILRELQLSAVDDAERPQLVASTMLDSHPDLVRLRVTVQGTVHGRPEVLHLELDVEPDCERSLSAVARAAALPAAALAYMVAAGAISDRGVVNVEKAVPLGPFVCAVRARGLEVREIWE